MSHKRNTIQDLPNEVLEIILIKAVVSEVSGLRLSRKVWSEKVDCIIRNLATVAENWDSIVSTDFFRNEVLRILSSFAQETIRLNIVHQYNMPFIMYSVTTWRNQLACIYRAPGQDPTINVYNLNNMGVVSYAVPLPRLNPIALSSCHLSDCMYILCDDSDCYSVFQITRDVNRRIVIVRVIKDLTLPISGMLIDGRSNVVLTTIRQGGDHAYVNTYDLRGALQHKVAVPDALYFSRCDAVFEKARGNMIVVTSNTDSVLKLTELDSKGNVVRQHQSVLGIQSSVDFADSHDRILVCEPGNRIELLDSEMNRLDFVLPRYNMPRIDYLQYDRVMDQVFAVSCTGYQGSTITVLQLTEN